MKTLAEIRVEANGDDELFKKLINEAAGFTYITKPQPSGKTYTDAQKMHDAGHKQGDF